MNAACRITHASIPRLTHAANRQNESNIAAEPKCVDHRHSATNATGQATGIARFRINPELGRSPTGSQKGLTE